MVAAKWGHEWANQQILFFTDNICITTIWKTGSCRDKDMMRIIRSLFLFTAEFNINILMKRIHGPSNILVDRLSRLCSLVPPPVSGSRSLFLHPKFLRSSLAPSTSSTYRTAWNSYQNFCLHANVRPYPLNQVVLLFYIVYLASRVSSTNKVYLSAVQYCSDVLCYQISMARMYPVFYLLRGIRRQQGSQYHRPRRYPITLLHL